MMKNERLINGSVVLLAFIPLLYGTVGHGTEPALYERNIQLTNALGGEVLLAQTMSFTEEEASLLERGSLNKELEARFKSALPSAMDRIGELSFESATKGGMSCRPDGTIVIPVVRVQPKFRVVKEDPYYYIYLPKVEVEEDVYVLARGEEIEQGAHSDLSEFKRKLYGGARAEKALAVVCLGRPTQTTGRRAKRTSAHIELRPGQVSLFEVTRFEEIEELYETLQYAKTIAGQNGVKVIDILKLLSAVVDRPHFQRTIIHQQGRKYSLNLLQSGILVTTLNAQSARPEGDLLSILPGRGLTLDAIEFGFKTYEAPYRIPMTSWVPLEVEEIIRASQDYINLPSPGRPRETIGITGSIGTYKEIIRHLEAAIWERLTEEGQEHATRMAEQIEAGYCFA